MLVEGGNPAVAGTGQRPGAVDDLLQDDVQVQALIDAQAGLAQPGQTVLEDRYLWVARVGFGQFFTSYERRSTLGPGSSGSTGRGHQMQGAVGPAGLIIPF